MHHSLLIIPKFLEVLSKTWNSLSWATWHTKDSLDFSCVATGSGRIPRIDFRHVADSFPVERANHCSSFLQYPTSRFTLASEIRICDHVRDCIHWLAWGIQQKYWQTHMDSAYTSQTCLVAPQHWLLLESSFYDKIPMREICKPVFAVLEQCESLPAHHSTICIHQKLHKSIFQCIISFGSQTMLAWRINPSTVVMPVWPTNTGNLSIFMQNYIMKL